MLKEIPLWKIAVRLAPAAVPPASAPRSRWYPGQPALADSIRPGLDQLARSDLRGTARL